MFGVPKNPAAVNARISLLPALSRATSWQCILCLVRSVSDHDPCASVPGVPLVQLRAFSIMGETMVDRLRYRFGPLLCHGKIGLRDAKQLSQRHLNSDILASVLYIATMP